MPKSPPQAAAHMHHPGQSVRSDTSQPHRGRGAQAAEGAAPLGPQMRALPSRHLRSSLRSCANWLPAGFSPWEVLAEEGRVVRGAGERREKPRCLSLPSLLCTESSPGQPPVPPLLSDAKGRAPSQSPLRSAGFLPVSA